MPSIGNKVAGGAIWMVAMKFIERFIGLISTLILARLLMPEDFGVVAMAMAVFAFVEIAGQFGFDIALIREQNATRAQYDSAWTISVLYGAIGAIVLAGIAGPVALFFNDPRLEPVIYVLAAAAFIQGFENIGTVDFRKNLTFGKDFKFNFYKKIVSFIVTIALALHFRSYWALIAGMFTSRVTGVALSYLLHPFRPRFDLSHARALFRFSKWIVTTHIIDYFGNRGPDFIMGRYLDAASIGLYRVGRDIATLPTSELIFPIMRAVLPGYAAIANDREALKRSFLQVQALIVMLSMPIGIGIVLVAEPMVWLMLGPNWSGSVPVIQILGLGGVVSVFQATNAAIFNVLGVPHWNTLLKALQVLLLIPGVLYLLHLGYGIVEVCLLILSISLVIVPLGMALINRQIDLRFSDRFGLAWRPVIATILMAASVHYTDTFLANQALTSPALVLLVCVMAGVSSYLIGLLSLWQFSGKPAGAEQLIMQWILMRLRRNAAG